MYESKDVISRNAYHPSGVWWGVVKLSSMNLPKLLQAILCHKAQSKHLSTYVKDRIVGTSKAGNVEVLPTYEALARKRILTYNLP